MKRIPEACARFAARAGFIDRDWIRRDGDLDALRDEAGYKKLLADEELCKQRDPE